MTSESATGTPRSRPRRVAVGWRPALDLVPAIALVLIAIWEMVAIGRAGGDVASDDDWESAAVSLRETWRVGDLIVFAPRWNDPVGRLHLGELLTMDDVGRMDADGYQIVWELSIRGARAPETTGRRLESEARFGDLTLRQWAATPVPVITDFRAEFKPEMATGGFVRRPTLSLEEVGFEPHRCILAIPRPGKTVLVRYPDVSLGSELVAYVGLADVFTRRDNRRPGRVEVRVNGELASSVEVGVNDGWVRFSAATRPAASATVEFALMGVGADAVNRHICFAAEARE